LYENVMPYHRRNGNEASKVAFTMPEAPERLAIVAAGDD
jgi:hypothetical protein